MDGLSVDKIHVWRGERHLLRGVSFALAPGQLLEVRGPNGAGKSTLLRAACGLTRPEQGEVRWGGKPIAAVRQEFLAQLAYAAHEPALKGDMTALENLHFAVSLRRRADAAELEACLERTGVGSCAELATRLLSAGQRRRVALARVLALRAPLWLLDEPFANLDAVGSAMLAAILREHVTGGGAALVVAHHDLAVGIEAGRLELAP
ncbi:MAG TPA: cytochrome c biogenesis heme-transporting ATPase CcmA [Steroidobacteraceae bacterium]|jgi:heme exporter protein A|nr:cytochrome c biogenesis heme-transporting ATPase CcmA [Steroidobacteraceae bacterium]